MISLDEFNYLLKNEIKIDLSSNQAQYDGVFDNSDDILMLVAGPGSGKTSILVLRALRHIFVDDLLPEQLLITTFTRKAAKELRTRWLDWGILIINALKNNPQYQTALNRIDLNRCRIDTLDSISHQALTENRLPGEIAPILIEGSASKLFLKRTSFKDVYDQNKESLNRFLSKYSFSGDVPRNQGEALNITKSLCERLLQEEVNLCS